MLGLIGYLNYFINSSTKECSQCGLINRIVFGNMPILLDKKAFQYIREVKSVAHKRNRPFEKNIAVHAARQPILLLAAHWNTLVELHSQLIYLAVLQG